MRIHHLLFADNIWLLSTCLGTLADMVKSVQDALEVFGWRMPLEEACWCTTVPDDIGGTLVVNGVHVRRSPKAVGFKALGVRLAFNGRCGSEVDWRIERAWAAFYAKKQLFLRSNASISARIRLLERLVPNTLLWCAGSWHATLADLRKIRSTQTQMLRKIIAIKRYPNEDLDAYMPRCYRCCDRFRVASHTMRWDERSQMYVARFAGHIARMRLHDPDRLTLQALHWRNQAWLDIVAENNNGNQLHCRRLKVWRWESSLVRFFGRAWEAVADDREEWERQTRNFSIWRCA